MNHKTRESALLPHSDPVTAALPRHLLGFIAFFLKQQKVAFSLIVLLSFAWSIDMTVWPYALKLLVNHLTAFHGPRTDIWRALSGVLLFMAGLWLTIEIAYRTQGFTIARTFPRLEAAVRMHMFDYVQHHSYLFFANHFAGNVSNKIADMTKSMTNILQLVMTLFMPGLLAVVIAVSIFFTINTVFAAMLLGWVIVHLGICTAFSKKCAQLADVHATSRSKLTGRVVDVFTNIINVKLFARQRHEYQYIQSYQRDEQQKNHRALRFIEIIKIALGISSFLVPGVLITWYEIYCYQHKLLNIGEVVLIFNTTWNIMTITWFAGSELPNLFKEVGVSQQAMRLIRAEHDVVSKPGAIDYAFTAGEIVFDQVDYGYLKSKAVFNGLSVTIPAGMKVGLVGFSGSGKSTFVNLMMRFFDLKSGDIRIDGQSISQMTLNSLRSQISIIPQTPTLFHRTLKENICYGRPNASDDDMIEATRLAHCHDFIMQLPEGYQSMVGERGIKLSGGQRQRVAIARAILDDTPILILDEATSALDSVTESLIQDSMQHLMADRTTIVVAHRLSTLAKMDSILVFDEGRIIERGTHNELLALKGHYAMMWHRQVGGFLPE